MQWAEMVVAIVLIVTIGRILRARYEGRGLTPPPQENGESIRQHEEIRALKERIAVLEKLATDDNSNAARLDREIERLRDRRDS
jgi:hypothetical protein